MSGVTAATLDQVSSALSTVEHMATDLHSTQYDMVQTTLTKVRQLCALLLSYMHRNVGNLVGFQLMVLFQM